MNPRKPLLLLAITVAISTRASASFELGLFGTSNLVYRYDVENHIMLGSFGQGKITGLRAVVGQQSTGEAFVLHAGGKGVAVFDYSTGSYKRGMGFGALSSYNHVSLGISGTLLASGGYSSTQEFATYDVNTGGLLAVRTLAAGQTALDFIQMPNGFYYGLAKRPNTSTSGSFEYLLLTYTSTGTTPINAFSLGSRTLPDIYKTLISSGNQFNYAGEFNTPSSNYLAQTGGSIAQLNTWSTPFSTSGTFATAYGHANQIYTFRRWSTATYEMVTWDPSINTFSGSMNITALPDNLVDGHIVLAPEPGSMAALALGLGAISRRRRNLASSQIDLR